MKKIPVTEQNKQMKLSATPGSVPSSVSRVSDAQQVEAEDPMAGLQADLDRFRGRHCNRIGVLGVGLVFGHADPRCWVICRGGPDPRELVSPCLCCTGISLRVARLA